nr:peptide-methionine (S)-S-oxide reductase MsrA [Brevibacterium sp. 68QC2CO]
MHVRTLTLAAGCFWCLDAVYRNTVGVVDVESGYIGGTLPDPDYRAVCTGATGHAEAVRVTFDEEQVPEDVILGEFFTGHDPTSLNRQGNDVGTQYRSAMFYVDEAQREHFQAAIDTWQELYERPIVTSLEPMSTFYPAEEYHQDFYNRNPFNGYCTFIIDPKVAQARRQWADWMK